MFFLYPLLRCAARGEIRLHALPEPAEFRCDVRLRDANDLGDLAIAVFVEVQKRESLVEAVEPFDELVETPDILQLVLRGLGYPEEPFIARADIAPSPDLAPLKRNRDVERGAVPPRRERRATVECAKRTPELDGDVLREVVPDRLDPGNTNCIFCRRCSDARRARLRTVPNGGRSYRSVSRFSAGKNHNWLRKAKPGVRRTDKNRLPRHREGLLGN